MCGANITNPNSVLSVNCPFGCIVRVYLYSIHFSPKHIALNYGFYFLKQKYQYIYGGVTVYVRDCATTLQNNCQILPQCSFQGNF